LRTASRGAQHARIKRVSYVLAFLGFAALIILHEAGHFVAAKAVGMRVERFSLFFGPMLIKRRWGETEYGIAAIPLGGYVKISGMNPEEELPPEVVPRAYYNQPVWKRIVVIGAGPAVNLLIAFVIAWGLFLNVGQLAVTSQVASIEHGSAAVGILHPGDQIVSVDGVGGGALALRNQIETHKCAGRQVNGCVASTPATVVVLRNGHRLTLRVRPRYSAAAGEPLIGFEFGTKQVPIGIATAASHSVSALWDVTTATLSAIAKIFEPSERTQLHTVVGVYVATQQSFATSATDGLDLIATLSLALGVINLFPFLPLDGGHIFWALAEKVRGKRISIEVMERAGFVGVALILMLFVIGLSNDISALTSGKGLGIH
jgi:regulator of sigma E protease